MIINTIKDVNNKEIKKLIEELEKIKTSKYTEYFSINSLEFNNFDEWSKTFKEINLTISAHIHMSYKKKEANKTTFSSESFNNSLLT